MVKSMRGGLFVLLFVLLVAASVIAGADNLAFVLYISAAVSAVGATLMTASGRRALQRIRRNATRGWSSRNAE
ncbi:hypothetical protein GCM10027060_11450 [Nesterenkonia halophila]